MSNTNTIKKEEVNIVNKTPHTVSILNEEGQLISAYNPVEPAVRISSEEKIVGKIGGLPLVETVFGDTIDLPEPIENTYYIVSRLVQLANPSRSDLICPAGQVRDENGRVVGCKGFSI